MDEGGCSYGSCGRWSAIDNLVIDVVVGVVGVDVDPSCGIGRGG